MSEILTLNRAARKLGVTARWLKAEADEGRIPHLRAGQRYLFDLAAATESLAERIRGAKSNPSVPDSELVPV